MGIAILVGLVLITLAAVATLVGFLVYGMYLGLISLTHTCRHIWLQFVSQNRW